MSMTVFITYSRSGNTFQQKLVKYRNLLCKSIDLFLYDTSFYLKLLLNKL